MSYDTDSPTQRRERLMKIKSRKIRKTVTLPDPRPEPEQPKQPEQPEQPVEQPEQQPEQRKVYDTVFVCYDSTPIIFGKLKGKNHDILKQPEWKKYCQWVVKQGDEFRYQPTRTYILENVNLE